VVAPVEIKVTASVDGKEDVIGLTGAIDGLGKEAIDAGAQADKASIGIDEVGKSAADASKKVEPLDNALVGVGNHFTQTGKDATAAATGVDSATTALSKTKPQADKAKDSIKGVGDSSGVASQALGQLAATMAAGFSVQQFIQAAAQVEQLAAGFKAVSGDAKEAAAQMDFVRRMAGAAGVDVVAAGQAFLGLAASTKGTAVEGKMAADVFEAVTVSMAKAGKSSAETQNALLALSQMASKGVVSMEELRGQLGEALPGALQAAASGLGVTTADLIKLVESGKIAADKRPERALRNSPSGANTQPRDRQPQKRLHRHGLAHWRGGRAGCAEGGGRICTDSPGVFGRVLHRCGPANRHAGRRRHQPGLFGCTPGHARH